MMKQKFAKPKTLAAKSDNFFFMESQMVSTNKQKNEEYA